MIEYDPDEDPGIAGYARLQLACELKTGEDYETVQKVFKVYKDRTKTLNELREACVLYLSHLLPQRTGMDSFPLYMSSVFLEVGNARDLWIAWLKKTGKIPAD